MKLNCFPKFVFVSEELNRLYDKYIPEMMLYVIEGVLDGNQTEKLKTIAPLTNLNLVSALFAQ